MMHQVSGKDRQCQIHNERYAGCFENASHPIGAVHSFCSAYEASRQDEFKGGFRENKGGLVDQSE